MADITGMLQAAAGYAASQTGEYQIERSLRFNSADTAYLSRTPASAGNRKTWTWSGWVKRSGLGGALPQVVFQAGNPTTPYTVIQFQTDNSIQVTFSGGVSAGCITSAVFRDVSAWYHILVSIDTTQATSTNRLKLFINNVEQSFGTANYPSQNYDSPVNNTVLHTIGGYGSPSGYDFSGYLTEVHFVDGQALTPSDFGETDATTGVWKPKAYTGTYGTNGFYLNFSDNTSTTTLGEDQAGSNDWTLNNFSVTAGAGNDSLVDTPTPYGTDTGAGGEVRGNYCTLNPLIVNAGTLTNGNLNIVTPVSGGTGGIGTMSIPTSGKWYWEFTPTNNGTQSFLGINDLVSNYVAYYASSGEKYVDGANSSYGATYGNNNVIGVAVDVDSSTITFYKDNVSQGAISYTTSGGGFFPYIQDGTNGASATFDVNFGQRPFAYTAPSGFKALCTQNLPEGTITTSGTFTGNGSTDGPFVYLNGVPTAMTIDGNTVTFGTHADKLANGFKVRSSSASYNANATSMSYTISTTGAKFKYANAQPNP